MNAVCVRLVKFCFVGAVGIGVQLGTLSMLRQLRINYLIATGVAVECAVIHNFLWHRHFTWADRIRSGMQEFAVSLSRFHLSNGLISLFGNIALMRFLVGELQFPVLSANVLAIALCFIANFLAGECWVFRLA
jgi:putative flippase GtrA